MPRLYTKSGHDFYVVASLLQKSIRRGDWKRAGYAANELYQDYPDFLWNRLLIISCEDCLAPITEEILALRKADSMVNKKKPRDRRTKIFVGKAIVLLIECYKGREADFMACTGMRENNEEMRKDPAFNQEVESLDINKLVADGEIFPDYVYDPHTWLGKVKYKRNFATNYDFDYIETKCLKPKPKQQSIFEGEKWVYDDSGDYTYEPKPYGAE